VQSLTSLKKPRFSDRTLFRVPNPFPQKSKPTALRQQNRSNKGPNTETQADSHFQKGQHTRIYAKHKKIKQTPAYLLKIQSHLDTWPFGIGKFFYAQATKPLSLWLAQPFALIADIFVGPLAVLTPAKARANNYLQMGIGLLGLAVLIYLLSKGKIPSIDIGHSGFLARTQAATILEYASIWAPIVFAYCGTSFIFASFRYRMRRSYLSWVNAKLKQIPAFDSGVEFWLGDKRTGVRMALQDLHTGISIYGSIGSGKCLAPNTLCMKWDGTLVQAKDIKPGDLLRGPDSTPRTVLTTTSGYGPLFKITPITGRGKPWICNAPHVLTLKYTSHGGSRRHRVSVAGKVTYDPLKRDKHYRGMELVAGNGLSKAQRKAFQATLKASDYTADVPLEDFFRRSQQSPSVKLSHYWKLFRVPADFEDNENSRQYTVEEFYLAGTWIGDGSKDHIAWTTTELQLEDAIKSYYIRSGRTMIEREITKFSTSKRLVHLSPACLRDTAFEPVYTNLDHLISEFTNYKSLGFKERKTPASLERAVGKDCDKQIPHWALTSCKEKRLNLLAGIIDTDGHLNVENRGIDIVQKRQWIAENIVWLARSLGLSSSEANPETKRDQHGTPGTYWRVHISGNIEIIPTRVTRKQTTTTRTKTRLLHGFTRRWRDPLVFGWDAQPIGDGQYCGFTLDGDGRFLLGDFTVTHNTQAIMNPLLDQIFRQLNLPEPTEIEKRDPAFRETADFKAWEKDPRQKVGGLILDRKGDFVDFVIYTMLRHGRPLTDLIIIDPEIELWRYNLLDTSLPKTTYAQYNSVRLAEMQKIAAGPQGGAGNEKFWDEASRDTVAMLLHILVILKPRHSIGLHHLARLVLKDELCQDYCDRAEEKTKERYRNNEIGLDEYNADMEAVTAVQNKWIKGEAEKIKPTLKLTVTQLLGEFAANPKLQRIFCQDTNFDFKKVINEGKVVLFRGGNTPIATCRKICVALKTDFQDWMTKRAGSNAQAAGVQTTRSLLFYVDEYQEFVTAKDSEYLAISRSARNIPVVATQGVTSYKKALNGNDVETHNLQQGLTTVVFLKTNDRETAQYGEDLVGEIEEFKERESVSSAGILDQTLHPSSSGAREQEVSIESKDYKKRYRRDDFMHLSTQDGNSSRTGPFYSEAIIINYHERDNKRKKGRAYKSRLRHVYDIDKQYDRDLKKGKVAHNTLAFNQIMYDRISQITTHLLFYPQLNSAMLRETTARDNFLTAVESRKKAEERAQKGQRQTEKDEQERLDLFEEKLPEMIDAVYGPEALNTSTEVGHLPVEDYHLKNYQEYPLVLLEDLEEVYRVESAKIRSGQFDYSQLQRKGQREIDRVLEIMDTEHRRIRIELNRRALAAATAKLTSTFETHRILEFKAEPRDLAAERSRSDRLSDDQTNKKYANLPEVVHHVVAAKTGINLKEPLSTELDLTKVGGPKEFTNDPEL
jgi:hypothetical protein